MLGPLGAQSNLSEIVNSLDIDGPIVSVTAGWRDSEGELDELQEQLGRPIEDLEIYHRSEQILAGEPELLALHRERQDKLQELQRFYRIRLDPTLAAARKLLRSTGQADLLRLEQRAAVTQVRALDRHHVARITSIHRDFDARRTGMAIHTAAQHLEEVHSKIEQAGLVLIAGGHVAVLLNRIRLFRLEDYLARKPIIAWSAGAMALCDRVVLFHDNAPQGRRNAEVLDAGLGIAHKLVPLPHAKTRLDWSNQTRMALFSRRFSPARCCTLDSGSVIEVKDHRIISTRNSSAVTRSGGKRKLVAR